MQRKDTHRNGFGQDDIPISFEQWAKVTPAPDIKVHVDATEPMEHKVPNSVGPLDRVGVRIVGRQERGVDFRHEAAGSRIRP